MGRPLASRADRPRSLARRRARRCQAARRGGRRPEVRRPRLHRTRVCGARRDRTGRRAHHRRIRCRAPDRRHREQGQGSGPDEGQHRAGAQNALGKCKRDDLVLVAFAGHGARADAKSAGYLCAKDAKPLPDGKASLISVEALCTELAARDVGAAVLLVDACQTAPAGDQPSGVDGSGLKVPARVFALFSCSPGERAVEHKDARHGVFFEQVLAGLNGSAADGDDAITFASLAAHLRTEVPKQTAKLVKDAKQTPAAHAPDGREAVAAPGRGTPRRSRRPSGKSTWVCGATAAPDRSSRNTLRSGWPRGAKPPKLARRAA